MAGKHVFVEKPMAATTEEAQRLVDEAARRRLVLAVDHTFVHTGAVRKMRELVESGLGEMYYYDSVRVNLGLFQHDVSVIWDLAVHDLSILDYVLRERPVAVSATGMSHVPGEPENIAYLNLFFESNLIAHIHVNWLAPVKVRRTLIGGSQQDDRLRRSGAQREDQGLRQGHHAQRQSSEAMARKCYQMLVGYRTGDMWAPQLDMTEALERRASPVRRLHRAELARRSRTDMPAFASFASSKQQPSRWPSAAASSSSNRRGASHDTVP